MKKKYAEIMLAKELFYLLPEKAMYRSSMNQLILADVHLGKATHFRKQGIALPEQSHLNDIATLHFLINTWKPETVLILGDLFHSEYNSEWEIFKNILSQYSHIQFILVEGNHDILNNENYSNANLLKVKMLIEDELTFTHHPCKTVNKINICGHIHPGIKIRGIAKQAIPLPCFYFNGANFILPAFGNLTGLHLLPLENNASYFMIAINRVVKL